MNRRILFFAVILTYIICFYGISPLAAKMAKEVAVGVMDDAPNQSELDRYYMRYHGPEVLRSVGPWLTRYQLWLPYEPPKEAVERFGAVRGRYAELWFHEDELNDLPKGISGMTLPDWPMDPSKSHQVVVDVPANPTETFYDSDPHPEKTTILRWVTIIAYPEGVSVEDGEKWFLNVYAKEAVKQPGLMKFVSYRILSKESSESDNKPPKTNQNTPPESDQNVPPQNSGMPKMSSWVRVCEYWYKDFAAWRKAVLESPPKYTVPSWGGEYPFVEMRSTFIPYFNDVDFLKGTYRVDFDQPKTIYNTTP